MQIIGITVDTASQAPIVLLREHGGERVLPIWVGVFEASAIALFLQGVSSERPLTHDLFGALFSRLNATLLRAEIVSLRGNTYYAELVLQGAEGELRIDARPSDAIAIGVREGVELLCDPNVLDRGHAQLLPGDVERLTGLGSCFSEEKEEDDIVSDSSELLEVELREADEPRIVFGIPQDLGSEFLAELNVEDFGRFKQ